MVDRYVRNAAITPPRDYFTRIVLPICVYTDRPGEIARNLPGTSNFGRLPSSFVDGTVLCFSICVTHFLSEFRLNTLEPEAGTSLIRQ